MVVFFCLLFSGCGSSNPNIQTVQISGQTMGTFYDVRVKALPTGETEVGLKQKIEEELELINDLMSTYRPDSQLMQFNNSTSTEWFPVDIAVVEVVQEANRISKLSEGTFDVTVGPLIEMWNFGVPQAEFQIPTDEQLDGLTGQIGWQLSETRTEPPALKKQHEKLFLNLSAIAKGYGVDRVGAVLESAGVRNYLVNIGGEILAKGVKAEGRSWRIAIEQPTTNSTASPVGMKQILLQDIALATSGNYRNFYEDVDGNLYSHTIDPRTKRPVTHQLLSASVLAENCMLADGLATTLMVMGPTEAMKFAERESVAVYLVFKDETGKQLEQMSPQFEAYLDNAK